MTDTLPKLLLRNASSFGDATALREKEFGIWRPITWSEYAGRVRNFSLGLRALGLVPDDKVAILGDNRPEWLIAELAAQSARAQSMGVYQDSVAEEALFLLDFSDARFVVAEDQEQVDKILEVREQLPRIERVIYYDPRGLRSYDHDFLISFEDVEALGAEQDPALFERGVEETKPDDIALLSTTSGTTGKPKLAMLTHRNLLSMASYLLEVDPIRREDQFVSFLPLAWIGEQMISVSCGMQVGFAINFPEEPETVQDNIREIGPHIMFAPPRIWENMVSEVQVKIEDSSWLKRKIYNWALQAGYDAADAKLAKEDPGFGLKLRARLADWTCGLWLRDKLGLRRIHHAYTGGAALGPDISRFFHAVGVNLKQIYGQTEVSGVSAIHRDDEIKFQTVGKAIPNTKIKIADDGEVLTKGPAVFVGYYKNEEATREALRDGWLYSGDAGYEDDDGHLIVIDRKKDVMTLGDGTRFSPQFIENKLKFSPYVREAVVFGGGSYEDVTALITIDFPNTGKWAERRQIPYTTFTDLAQKEEVYGLITTHTERTNDDLPGAAKIRRFLLLHKELDADDEELTRTRKIRRTVVADRYAEIVQGLYDGSDTVSIESEITYQDGSHAQIKTRLKIETVSSRGE